VLHGKLLEQKIKKKYEALAAEDKKRYEKENKAYLSKKKQEESETSSSDSDDGDSDSGSSSSGSDSD